MLSQSDKAERFRRLHAREGAFIIPNPWDVGSAKLLAGLGFEALATTSYGFAQTLGRSDGMVTLEEKLAHCRLLCSAVDIPISADLENGFGDDPEVVAATIRAASGAGLVGGSIEDHTGDPANPIYDFEHAVERVMAAVEAARSLECPFILTARAENFFWGRFDLEDAIRRLQAFEAAGADVLYAPGLRTLDEVREVTGALNRPVNVLAPFVDGATVEGLADAGAKRISVGGALYRGAIAGILDASVNMQEQGSFAWTDDLPSSAKIAQLRGEE